MDEKKSMQELREELERKALQCAITLISELPDNWHDTTDCVRELNGLIQTLMNPSFFPQNEK